MAAKRMNSATAQICLYGNHETGAGWIARITSDLSPDKGKLLGDGEPKAGRSNTEAVWLACNAIQAEGITRGTVRIFAPGGRLMADADLQRIGYFGDLQWRPATVVVVPMEAILAAAE